MRESNYAAFANNPIYFVDVLGDKFDPASQKIVDKHKKETQSRINDFDRKINKLESRSKLSKKQQSNLDYFKSAKGELSDALVEIGELELSDQMYSIRKTQSSTNMGYLSYDNSSDIVYVNYDGSINALGHELKHAFQFEKHQLSFGEDPNNPMGEWKGGCLYDGYDELEAYKRDFAYDRNGLIGVNSFNDINPTYIKNKFPNLYYPLPNGVNGNTSAKDVFNAKGRTVPPLYNNKTILDLIRDQNSKNAIPWEKIR